MKPLLTPEIMHFLADQISVQCDLTLVELVALVNKEYDVLVSTKTMSRMLLRANLGLKKNALTRPNALQTGSFV